MRNDTLTTYPLQEAFKALTLRETARSRRRRYGLVAYRRNLRLPYAIFALDDGREVLLDHRFRPILERAPDQAIGVPARIRPGEIWKRRRSANYLDNTINRLPPTEPEQIARAKDALRYFGVEPPETKIDGGAR